MDPTIIAAIIGAIGAVVAAVIGILKRNPSDSAIGKKVSKESQQPNELKKIADDRVHDASLKSTSFGASTAKTASQFTLPERLSKILSHMESTGSAEICFIREPELNRLISTSPLNNIAVVGEFGSGKTELLRQFKQSPLSSHSVIVYLGVGDPELQYPSVFWRYVVLKLTGYDLGDIGGIHAESELLDRLDPKKRYILCLDDIDDLRRSPSFSDIREWELIRTVLTQQFDLNIGLVVTSRTYLSAILPSDDELRSSPWWNVFIQLNLAEVSEKRARQLLQSAGIGKPNDINFCFNVARKILPFDLRLLSHLILAYKPTTSEDYERVASDYDLAIEHKR